MQTIPTIDLYRELEVDPAATAETIEAAWKSLLKRHHPDVAADPAASAERVKRLNLAHDWLSDPSRRAQYDLSRRRPGVVVIPRGPTTSADRAGRRPTTVSPKPSTGDTDPAHKSAAPPRSHNPYSEFATPTRGAPAAPVPKPVVSSKGRNRTAAFVVPVALLSVVAVVAAALQLGGQGGPAGAAAAAKTPDAIAASSPAGSARPSRSPVNPNSLPAPVLAAAAREACPSARLDDALRFEATADGDHAYVYVVPCGKGKSFGPLVYAARPAGWEIVATGNKVDGLADHGFAGSITGASQDEFGIAWKQPDGMTTATLYDQGRRFWESDVHGMKWGPAKFSYEDGSGSSGRGKVDVRSADLSTGTLNCAACTDHNLYEETYVNIGTGTLKQTSHKLIGTGLP